MDQSARLGPSSDVAHAAAIRLSCRSSSAKRERGRSKAAVEDWTQHRRALSAIGRKRGHDLHKAVSAIKGRPVIVILASCSTRAASATPNSG